MASGRCAESRFDPLEKPTFTHFKPIKGVLQWGLGAASNALFSHNSIITIV